MQSLTSHLGDLPSPLPKQFLVGIDEQQLDLERGYASYFAGQWYPEGVWWYYLVGTIFLALPALYLLIGIGVDAVLRSL